MAILPFGKVQMRMMRILWEQRRITARDLTDKLNLQQPIAHSTVQTLLRTLEDKGAVGHDSEGRTFYFFPLVDGDQAMMNSMKSFIENVFGGSPGDMVSYLVRKQYVTPQEIRNIAAATGPGE
jgi:BlaI family transcriptional regulator, penicillinase repressor